MIPRKCPSANFLGKSIHSFGSKSTVVFRPEIMKKDKRDLWFTSKSSGTTSI